MVAAAALLAPAGSAMAGGLEAGAAVVDASWHVGASAGQYASDGFGVDPSDGTYDPTTHSTRRKPSYGMQSRLEARALVVEGPGGNRMALVKNDLYIPQDLLWRRTAQLLERKPQLGIGRENLTIAVSHNHSSPYYSSAAWGVWAFQDVFDVRFYNYYAERMALAVERAVAGLVPARVGAGVEQFDKTHRHSFGTARADDGTPAGYPVDDTDHDLTVVRFDDVSDPQRPKPLANIVNFGLHPEFLDGNDLISEDYLAPLERMTDRATGAVTIFTQNAVGTSEPERSSYHSIRERLEFSHKEYGQAEYGARLMSDAAVRAWRDVGAVPFRSAFEAHEVAFEDRWFPGPVSHPYPGVSNCRTDSAFEDPRLPVVGLPNCMSLRDGLDTLGLPGEAVPPAPIDPGLSTDDFQRAGVPVPENYSAPSYGALQEDVDVHLQAFRIGGILFAVCSCEQWHDQGENIKTRTDEVAGNEHLGFDWKQRCAKNGDGSYGDGPEGYGTGTWSCPPPADPTQKLPDQAVERMHRQVTNPANGWNDLDYAPFAESEPTDLRQIKGNYTHDDDARSAQLGYELTVPIAMANDYNGYIATYREYQRGDAYRKALSAWGPHASDYMATRLVNMGRVLNGGDRGELLPPEYGDGKVAADLVVNDVRAAALGDAGSAAVAGYEARLPDDGGEPGARRQPPDVERFDGTFFSWNGGSNYTDNPRVRVQRRAGGEWRDFAGQDGEVPITVEYPQGTEAPSYETGSFEWVWTAHFEAFAARFDTVEGGRATPAGTYRFVVEGERRKGRRKVGYRVESEAFAVRPWSGITVEDLRREADGTVSLTAGPTSRDKEHREVDGSAKVVVPEVGPIDYPDSYDYGEGGPALPRFISERPEIKLEPGNPDPAAGETFCFDCSFRPWIDAGDAATAELTFERADGSVERVAATKRDGRWRTAATLGAGDAATVGRGCLKDAFGNFNGAASRVGPAGAGAAADCATEQPDGGEGGAGGGAGGAVGQAIAGAGPPRCAPATARARGRSLGRARLGARRARQRRAFPSFTRPRARIDRFCLRGGRHLRVGYRRGRAALILSAGPRYSVRGVRPGASAAALRRRVPGLRAVTVGGNRWLLGRGRSARLVFKLRRGRVLEVGLAGLRDTATGARARRFLRGFS